MPNSGRRHGPPNVLLITVDDMNWDTVGVYGRGLPGCTPGIDALAARGVRFDHAHVTAAVCQPSRQSMMTGRYPHNMGAPGFDPIDPATPTLQEQLRAAGYLNGILGKVAHLAPEAKFCWDMVRRVGDLGAGRSPRCYGEAARAFLAAARRSGRPFFLMANSHDPHRPFSGSRDEGEEMRRAAERPSRVYRADEITVPGFLPDLPDVRTEVAQYASSSRRADDTVGAVLAALAEAGFEEDSLVMFLSDNGMAFPFAKTNCYLHSTKTPWIIRWPGRIPAGTVDREHFVCGADFAPTILDAARLPPLPGMDGRSFLPVLRGERQAQRESVFTVFNVTAARRAYPMRCVQDRRWGYIFNAWSDGRTAFVNESQTGLTMAAMRRAAQGDEGVASRVRHFLYRVPEELYDFERDPDALRNLVGDCECGYELRRMRRLLAAEMGRTRDPLLGAFRARVGEAYDPA